MDFASSESGRPARRKEVPMLNLKKISQNQLLSAFLMLIGGICTGLLSLNFAATLQHDEMFQSYLDNRLLLFLNLAPVVVIMFLLWFITRSAALSFGLGSLIVLGLTLVSWFKLQFRNDPLLFEDLFLAKEAGNMTGRYSLFVTKSMVAAAVLVILGVVFLHFFARGHLNGKTRLIGTAVCLAICFILKPLYTSADIYNNKTQNFDLINRWSATQLYISKGFVYPFLHSIQDAIDTPPSGYSEKAAIETLAQYEDADIPEGQKVDVIGIMLEAYNDLSKFDGLTLNQDVYQIYHDLEKEGVSGNLVTNIFAGGTVDTERCFVTGFSDLGSFRAPTNSYARYFASQGYTVTGSHPSFDWFYNRVNINANLGFESYDFLENHYGEMTNGEIAMDHVLFPELIRLHQQSKQENGKPYFSFSVTYQGHGPYSAEENWYDTDYVPSGLYSKETENILNNYFGSIERTNQSLAAFFDHYRQSSEPVVIILFGDHNPWLGDGNSVYHELGIDLDFSQQQGFLNYYGTRYLIWANDAAKEALEQDFTGHGPDIGPYFLMNEVFQRCGWKGPAFMQATNAVMAQVPVISTTGLFIENGRLTDSPSERGAELIGQYKCLEYYWRKTPVG